MKVDMKSVLLTAGLLLTVSGWAETLSLRASKDSFGRSNRRTQNSGGSTALYMAHNSMLRAIVEFDLSSVTNRIVQAELVIVPSNTNEKPMSLVVAPMADTSNNAAWHEGSGAMGASGRNAMVGESTFSHSAFPDTAWEAAPDQPVTGLGDEKLWSAPVVQKRGLEWERGQEVQLTIDAASLLERIRTSDQRTVTFGFWGTDGNGYYAFDSRESGDGPLLVLTLQE